MKTLDINWQKEDSQDWAENLNYLSSLKKLCIYHKLEDGIIHEYNYLQKLTQLTTLSLVYFRRTIPFESSFLKNLMNLKNLCIGNSMYLTDSSISYISILSNLEHLSMFSANITDIGSQQLHQLTNLRILDISCNHNITGKLKFITF